MPVPTIASVSPNVGFTGGKSLVEIRGTNFQTWTIPPFNPLQTAPSPAYTPTVQVLFGGVPGARVAVVAPNRLFVIAPPSPLALVPPAYGEGAVDVTVKNVNSDGIPIAGEVATFPSAYTYQRVQLNQLSDYARVTRTLVLELRKQVIANVSIGQHADYDQDPTDLLSVVDVAQLPAVVLFGPTPQENRFYSVNGRVYGRLQGHESDSSPAPDTDDLIYTFVGISDQKHEELSLQNVMRQFFMNNRWLRVDRDPTDPSLGFVEYDLYYQGQGGMPGLPPPDQKSSLRSFSGTFAIRGFNFEAQTGFPLSNRWERTHQVLEVDHQGPLVPEPLPPADPVTPPPTLSSTKNIVTFDFPDGVGVIGVGTVAVTVPFGTDVTALIPTITHNGASVSPTSGSPQNFSSPVAYTVTAADGSTQQYTVSVTVRPLEASTTMRVGTNFWYLTPPTDNWSGELAMVPGINWATAYGAGINGLGATNIWNPAWLAQLEPYSSLRFMDWGNVNSSKMLTWLERRAPTDAGNYEAYNDQLSVAPNPGLAYEWMIDLCNRTNKDMWICVPHQVDNNFVQQLATLIHSKLKSTLRVYVEYSNETWNGSFSQFNYSIAQGQAMVMPGSNQFYQGQAYCVWRSLQAFDAFQSAFGAPQMGSRVVRVFAFGGNMDTGREGLANVYESATWNPSNQVIDMLAVAPYVGSELDGASPTIATDFHAEIAVVEADVVATAVAVKAQFSIARLGCYEGGQHLLHNSQAWSADPRIYDEYRYMLTRWATHFDLFMHYVHTGRWTNAADSSSWGALDNTNQAIGQAHKYRAIVDWLIANP